MSLIAINYYIFITTYFIWISYLLIFTSYLIDLQLYIGYATLKGALIKPALEILKRYNYKLPVISNVKYNEYLKIVAQAAHIDKPVSSHWARHTGATILLNRGIPMQIVAKICGHSSTRITEQVYAKLLDETVVDAVKKLKDKP